MATGAAYVPSFGLQQPCAAALTKEHVFNSMSSFDRLGPRPTWSGRQDGARENNHGFGVPLAPLIDQFMGQQTSEGYRDKNDPLPNPGNRYGGRAPWPNIWDH